MPQDDSFDPKSAKLDSFGGEFADQKRQFGDSRGQCFVEVCEQDRQRAGTERIETHRLGQEVDGARFGAGFASTVRDVRRHHDDRDWFDREFGAVGVIGAGGLEPVEFGHVPVHEYGVERVGEQPVERLLAVVDHDAGVAKPFKLGECNDAVHFGVIRDQQVTTRPDGSVYGFLRHLQLGAESVRAHLPAIGPTSPRQLLQNQGRCQHDRWQGLHRQEA
ncbi:hypothetical protein GQR58_030081 [Nymphon striatum]|nr:hypothetical protein GQR58_030081 [Nymphon striatum]